MTAIFKKENTIHITKTGMEVALAAASLTAAITAILIATSAITAPFALISMVANPVGIAILAFATLYFVAQAVSSYQQMNANLKVENAVETVKTDAGKAVNQAVTDAKITDQVTKVVADAKISDQVDKAVTDKKLVTEDALKVVTEKLVTKDDLIKVANVLDDTKAEAVKTALNIAA